jgi:hypothetical protein
MSDDLRRLEVLHEAMQDDIKKILDVLSSQQKTISRIPVMADDIKELKADMKTVKKVLKITNSDLNLLERRVTKLETV